MNNKVKKEMYHIHDKSYKDLYSKKEIAKNLLDVLDDETIATKTGLDIEEIKMLRKES